MKKSLSQLITEAGELQKQYELLNDNKESKPKDVEKAHKAWQDALNVIRDLEQEISTKDEEAEKKLRQAEELAAEVEKKRKEIEQESKKGKRETTSAPAKISGAIVGVLKKLLIEQAPKVLGKNKNLVPDKNYVDAVDRLTTGNCEVEASNGNVHVVHAGPFGVRKVTVE